MIEVHAVELTDKARELHNKLDAACDGYEAQDVACAICVLLLRVIRHYAGTIYEKLMSVQLGTFTKGVVTTFAKDMGQVQ